ncbi:MAG: hypothetical protein AAF191_11620 [Verrucomicrobiota bacterium]
MPHHSQRFLIIWFSLLSPLWGSEPEEVIREYYACLERSEFSKAVDLIDEQALLPTTRSALLRIRTTPGEKGEIMMRMKLGEALTLEEAGQLAPRDLYVLFLENSHNNLVAGIMNRPKEILLQEMSRTETYCRYSVGVLSSVDPIPGGVLDPAHRELLQREAYNTQTVTLRKNGDSWRIVPSL